ncbi:hypothetical protein AB0O51_27675 [Streptomyces sp. NPDC090301]|uniref:hypothetical protein n=1 Tax=Streptomyces sp. NPDC090301 TaxID=3154975 RepID=UPI003417BA8E
MDKPRTKRNGTAKTAAAKAREHGKEVMPSNSRWYWLPDPVTRCGAVFYAIAGPVVVTAAAALAEFVISHVHITIG